jgi:hypothetical protein
MHQELSGFWCEHSATLKLFAAKINAIALSPVCEYRAEGAIEGRSLLGFSRLGI